MAKAFAVAFIIFICAGTPATGAGHLTRCLALAGAYRDAGWRVEFILNSAAFTNLLSIEYPWHVADSGQTLDVLAALAPDGCNVLVLDNYAQDERFESACRSFARRIIVLDDQSGRRHECDLLIDAAAPDPSCYGSLANGSTRILTGPKYALIRTDILERRLTAIASRRDRKVANVLVSFGATDPAGLTLETIDAIADSLREEVTITAALSSRAPAIDAVRSRTSKRIRLRVDADMGEVIAAADLAIGAGGVGAFERAVLGLPTVIVTAAENQRGVVRLLIEAGAALDGGTPGLGFAERIRRELARLLGDDDGRNRIAAAAASVIDGRAAERIRLESAQGFKTSSGAMVRLRLAELADEEWLLCLQQEPSTRRFARNPQPPSPKEHARWLARTLEGGSSSLAIIEVDGTAAGIIRLDRPERFCPTEPQFEVSIAVSAAFHGCGIGSAALRLIRSEHPVAVFDAFILPGNDRSLRMFRKEGYIDIGNGHYRSAPP